MILNTIYKKALALIGVFIIANTFILSDFGLTSYEHPNDSKFSIDAKNLPLKNIFRYVAKVSGYTIILYTDSGDVRISIELRDVTIHEAVNRLLAKLNHFAIWDESQKQLKLYIFDTKGSPFALSGRQMIFEPATKTTSD